MTTLVHSSDDLAVLLAPQPVSPSDHSGRVHHPFPQLAIHIVLRTGGGVSFLRVDRVNLTIFMGEFQLFEQ